MFRENTVGEWQVGYSVAIRSENTAGHDLMRAVGIKSIEHVWFTYTAVLAKLLNVTVDLQVISLAGWVNIMYYIQDAHSFWDWIYFVALIVVWTVFSWLLKLFY